MGRRTSTQSVVMLLVAFTERETWRQPDLAKRVGVGTHALKRLLDDCTLAGVPVERTEATPIEIYWSLSPRWLEQAHGGNHG